jgi:hypothetical protein
MDGSDAAVKVTAAFFMDLPGKPNDGDGRRVGAIQ